MAVIHGETNLWTSAENLRDKLTRDALLIGHGYVQVVRNDARRPLELLLVDPNAVTIKADDYGEPS